MDILYVLIPGAIGLIFTWLILTNRLDKWLPTWKWLQPVQPPQQQTVITGTMIPSNGEPPQQVTLVGLQLIEDENAVNGLK